jgi:hypothetical protein
MTIFLYWDDKLSFLFSNHNHNQIKRLRRRKYYFFGKKNLEHVLRIARDDINSAR